MPQVFCLGDTNLLWFGVSKFMNHVFMHFIDMFWGLTSKALSKWEKYSIYKGLLINCFYNSNRNAVSNIGDYGGNLLCIYKSMPDKLYSIFDNVFKMGIWKIDLIYWRNGTPNHIYKMDNWNEAVLVEKWNVHGTATIKLKNYHLSTFRPL